MTREKNPLLGNSAEVSLSRKGEGNNTTPPDASAIHHGLQHDNREKGRGIRLGGPCPAGKILSLDISML